MKRNLTAAALLAFGAVLVCRASDTGYHVKAVAIDGDLMEAKFVQPPDDLRIVCKGDPKGISVGDYVKIEWKGKHFVAGKMVCIEIKWNLH